MGLEFRWNLTWKEITFSTLWTRNFPINMECHLFLFKEIITQFIQCSFTPSYWHSYLVIVRSLTGVWLFATPWNAAHQLPLSFTISLILLKFVSMELVMLTNHLILWCSCSARSPSPRSGKKTPRNNATCNRGIYYWLEPGPPALTKGVRMKRPRAPVLSGIY